MFTIHVKNLNLFQDFIEMVSKFSQQVMIDMSVDKCLVSLRNSDNTMQSLFETNSLIASQDGTFCLNDLSKFYKCLKIFASNYSENTVDMEYDGTYVRINHPTMGFQYRVMSPEVLESYNVVSKRKSINFPYIWTMKLTSDHLKKILATEFMAEIKDRSPRIYLSKSNDMIIAELDDKQSKMPVNSIKIPLTSEFTGDWCIPVIVNMEMLRSLNKLKNKSFDVEVNEKRIILCKSESQDVTPEGEFYLKSFVLLNTIKD